jgi:hypothetical protein
MKKVFWILVVGALASASMAFGLGHAANGEVIAKNR